MTKDSMVWLMWAVYDKGKYGSGLCGQYMTMDSMM